MTVEARRFCAGYVNPPDLESADNLHEHLLEVAPYHLDFNPLDCEALDVLFAFDFMFNGNHDEVVAEALGMNTTLESLLQMPGSKVINYEPSLMLSLDEACRSQCRLSDRDAHQRLPDPHRPVPRGADQRLFHRPPVLGPAALQGLRRVLPPPAPHLPGPGRIAYYPLRGPPPGPDHRGQTVKRPKSQGQRPKDENYFCPLAFVLSTSSEEEPMSAVSFSQFARGLTAETAFDVLAVAKRLKSAGKDVIELQIGDSPFRQHASCACSRHQGHRDRARRTTALRRA